MKPCLILALVTAVAFQLLLDCEATETQQGSTVVVVPVRTLLEVVTQKSELNRHKPSVPSLANGWVVLRNRGGAGGGATTFRTPPKTSRNPWEKTATTTTTAAATDNLATTKDVVSSFLTRDSRNTFISRVYAILAVQLLVTAASVFLFGKYDWAGKWMSVPGTFGAAVPGISLLISTIAWYIMFVSPTAKKSSPLKWQILTLFTLGEAISVGFLTSFFKFQSVMTSVITTAVSTMAVSVYTIANRNSKYDLSMWGATLSQAGLIFLALGFIQLLEILHILPKGFLPISDKVLSFAGATLFSFYLAHHTRTIVSGKNTKHQMDDKDYVYGAMTLYNDIINIFVYILKILGDERDH